MSTVNMKCIKVTAHKNNFFTLDKCTDATKSPRFPILNAEGTSGNWWQPVNTLTLKFLLGHHLLPFHMAEEEHQSITSMAWERALLSWLITISLPAAQFPIVVPGGLGETCTSFAVLLPTLSAQLWFLHHLSVLFKAFSHPRNYSFKTT